MAGPKLPQHYNDKLTQACKQVLALLISGLGDWRDSVVLIGGLTPEMLTRDTVEKKRPYVGTADIDLVVNLEILANLEAYSTIEHVLINKGFKPLVKGGKAWQWEFTSDAGDPIVIDFLADDGSEDGRKILPVPENGQLAACNIPHSNIAFDHQIVETIEIELPQGGGFKQVPIRYTDIVGFTALKALAFDNRSEDKDAHDLVYCLEHCGQSPVEVAARIVAALAGNHADTIERAIAIMARSFTDDANRKGFEKDGPAQAARFEPDLAGNREALLLRQRDIAELLNELLSEIGKQRG